VAAPVFERRRGGNPREGRYESCFPCPGVCGGLRTFVDDQNRQAPVLTSPSAARRGGACERGMSGSKRDRCHAPALFGVVGQQHGSARRTGERRRGDEAAEGFLGARMQRRLARNRSSPSPRRERALALRSEGAGRLGTMTRRRGRGRLRTTPRLNGRWRCPSGQPVRGPCGPLAALAASRSVLRDRRR
jgi:hypothetical protein